jgi:hypothetical protein
LATRPASTTSSIALTSEANGRCRSAARAGAETRSLGSSLPLARKLAAARSASLLSSAIDQLLVARAEKKYEYLFARNGWQLARIAADAELKTLAPYSAFARGAEVIEPRCIAEIVPETSGTYRIIDGIHRAIQLAWNDVLMIDLCVLVS